MSPTRLGTAQALLILACCLAGSALPAQEDVAETKNTATIDTTPITEPPITLQDRAHWSFQPIRKPAVPQIRNPQSVIRNPIDLFILQQLEAKNLAPAPAASRHTLLRRLSLDLHGLPPTPRELAAFQADQSPDAYERLVDRLLASPAFGDRYGQYWLDLARFAETDGYEHDKVRKEAWRYRDWVITALNADLPYDDFIRLQLAGDETPSPQPPARSPSAVATMFCLSGPDMPDINDQLERRHILMNEMTATVGAVFLGLQLGCAQCHNHKYDPLSQADFYRFRALFEPAVPALKRDIPVAYLANLPNAPPARYWVRGDHRRPGLELTPAFPRIASGDTAGLTSSANSRAALATWLTSSDNPLTARVVANRVWQWHFGRGLAANPSDFGVMGSAPTHPELLDHLAANLTDHAWSLKHLHRAILTSATYRQASSSANLQSAIRNPQSDGLYAAFPRQRLTGEAIRDSMLAAAGLITSERGGPGVMPPLPEELLGTLLKGQWTASKRQSDHYKRSVYVFARRNLRYPIFEAFDRPDGNATCPIRNRSTTAPQSLLLFNSEFSLLAAQHLAGRVSAASDRKRQINQLYQIAFSRQPSAEETSTLENFLQQQTARLTHEARPKDQLALPIPDATVADPYSAAALVDACLALLNNSEFLYVD